MATRNIRPRVLTAIHELGTFTIGELCSAAGLKDRNQAYYQLGDLKRVGFITEKTLPSFARHAPFKEYSLVSDPDLRSKFAEELGSYRPARPRWAESELGKLAVTEATTGLERIEQSLTRLEAEPETRVEGRLSVLDREFETARTNIATARLEYSGLVSKEKSTPNPVPHIADRLQQADARRKELTTVLEVRPAIPSWGPMLRGAAAAVCHTLSSGFAGEPVSFLTTQLSKTLDEESRAQVEVLLDAIRADPKHPFASVFRSALRTGDASIVYDVVKLLKKIDLDWWKYNLENTCYLKNSKFSAKNWLAAYWDLRKNFPFQKKRHCTVYSCTSGRLTKEVYLDLTKGRSVSVVSPHAIGFLGASEVVGPTLLIESGSRLTSLDCTFLKPGSSLHAYGPIADDVTSWQGAPDLRVAACLGMWGLPLEEKLSQVVKPLKENRDLLVLQGKTPTLNADATAILDAKEIGACAV